MEIFNCTVVAKPSDLHLSDYHYCSSVRPEARLFHLDLNQLPVKICVANGNEVRTTHRTADITTHHNASIVLILHKAVMQPDELLMLSHHWHLRFLELLQRCLKYGQSVFSRVQNAAAKSQHNQQWLTKHHWLKYYQHCGMLKDEYIRNMVAQKTCAWRHQITVIIMTVGTLKNRRADIAGVNLMSATNSRVQPSGTLL